MFVTRDRRSVFGAVTSLGELDELVAKLQGSPLQVKQAAAEVARLQSIEAEQVFDALRAKVRDAENLTQEPVGRRIKAGDLKGSDPIVRQIARKEGVERYDHNAPAEVLLRERAKRVAALSVETLDAFEALFKRINSTLS